MRVNISKKIVNWCITAVGLGILLFLVLGFLSIRAGLKEYVGTFTNPGLKQVSEITAIKFPEGTQLLQSLFHNGMRDRTLLTKLEMNKNQVEPFIKSIPNVRFVSQSQGGHRWIPSDKVALGRNIPWWNINSVKNSLIINAGSDAILRIMISMDYPKRAVVYLYYTHD